MLTYQIDNELTNLFLGALIVRKLDYWINRSFDFIDNENPAEPFEREWSEAAQKDKAYRACLSMLPEETKIQLKKLLQESVEGVVFSVLSELDEDWTIELNTDDMKGIANAYDELHDDFYKWTAMFRQLENQGK